MTEKNYDVIIIGSGPGGYSCALACAKKGFHTLLVEKYSTVGGTCLNVGCIPSKALLDSTELFHQATHNFQTMGISAKSIKPEWKTMLERKDDVVAANEKGIRHLLKKAGADVISGVASFVSKNTLKVKVGNDATEALYGFQKAVIATGSKPASVPGLVPDKKRIITSTEALKLDSIPKSMLVVGAGAIGLEMGSVYARLGTQVHVVEYADRILPSMDTEISKTLEKLLKNRLQMKISTGTLVTDATATARKVTGKIRPKNSEKTENFEAEYVLVATGRKPFTELLELDQAGIEITEKGFITVDQNFETAVSGIYAIGDVIGGPMLAHKAEDEGLALAEHLSGHAFHYDPSRIPGVVYTWPEAASVGLSEEQAQEANISFEKGVFPFRASGRARAAGDVEGFVKVLSHSTSGEILGVHILGHRAADLIAEAVTAIELNATAEDLAMICHPHPTFSEALKEAASLAATGQTLHL